MIGLFSGTGYHTKGINFTMLAGKMYVSISCLPYSLDFFPHGAILCTAKSVIGVSRSDM